LQKEFDICWPEDCGSVKLADFEGKNILIIYEFDWWPGCYPSIPQLEDDIIIPFIDHPNLAIINVLNDGPGTYNCTDWGQHGDSRIPIIINENPTGDVGDFNNWFSGSGEWTIPFSSPWYILIDDNFNYVYISPFGAEHDEVVNEINVLLED